MQSRREFLKKMQSASLAAMATSIPTLGFLGSCSEVERKRLPSTADSVILLWMAGGMAHTETFDPKKYAPFEKSMEAKKILSTFPSVPTVIDGLHFSEGLEEIGKVMDKGAIIRSYRSGDLATSSIRAINIIGIPAMNLLSPSSLHILVPG